MSSRPPNLVLLPSTPAADPLVLLVDDYVPFRRALVRHPCAEHRRVCVRWLEADGGDEALMALAGLEAAGDIPSLVVSDMSMGGMGGTELLAIVGRRWPGTRRMMLSALTTGEQVMEMHGEYPVVAKDWGGYDLVGLVCKLARGGE